MSTFPYVDQRTFMGRDDLLGPALVNQAHVNIEAIDEVARMEHFADGQHNALEIPWVLGHMDDGSPPTGYLFDTAYGGGTLARPATGRYTTSVVSGVITSDDDGNLLASTMANVADSAIEVKPHTVTCEAVSATSMQFRVRSLSSALGAGNTWADVNRDIDIGIHALAQNADGSLLASHLLKQRRDFLTQAATDWSALVANQGVVRKAALLEHSSTGLHSLNRIAKAVAWVRWNGAAYELTAEEGVASIATTSAGICTLTMDANFTSTNNMACFPEAQPATPAELPITHGRGFGTGAGTSTFRFYTYAFDGVNWDRADRSFFVAMYGVVA